MVINSSIIQMMVKKALLTLIVLMSSSIVFSQDLHLTQYLSSNLSLNPAYTGHYDGDYRFTLNHRNQWRQLPSPMVTNQLSVEKRIEHFNKEFGLGLYVANDKVKAVSLQQSEILLSGAYQFNRNNHLFSLGVQSGVILRQTDFNAQTFPEQWNYSAGIFDNGFSTNELQLMNNDNYLDVNVGGAWKKQYNRWILNAGLSFFHLNRPKTGLSGKDVNRLPIRKTVDLRADYSLTQRVTITPTVLYTFTTRTKDALFGVMGMYAITKDLEVGVAVNYRGSVLQNDAFIPTLLMGYKRFKVGFSNDYNISGLSAGTNTKTSYEISIIYTTPSATPTRVTIPCERI